MPPLISVPPGLAKRRTIGAEWGVWLDHLPGLARQLLDEWDLVVDDVPGHGFCSLVVPVRAGTTRAVLKLSFDGDDESEFEALALQLWGGRGTVRLLRADPGRRALLLERLHQRDLASVDDPAACEIVAGLYRHLHLPAPPQLRTVTSYVERWVAALGDPAPVRTDPAPAGRAVPPPRR